MPRRAEEFRRRGQRRTAHQGAQRQDDGDTSTEVGELPTEGIPRGVHGEPLHERGLAGTGRAAQKHAPPVAQRGFDPAALGGPALPGLSVVVDEFETEIGGVERPLRMLGPAEVKSEDAEFAERLGDVGPVPVLELGRVVRRLAQRGEAQGRGKADPVRVGEGAHVGQLEQGHRVESAVLPAGRVLGDDADEVSAGEDRRPGHPGPWRLAVLPYGRGSARPLDDVLAAHASRTRLDRAEELFHVRLLALVPLHPGISEGVAVQQWGETVDASEPVGRERFTGPVRHQALVRAQQCRVALLRVAGPQRPAADPPPSARYDDRRLRVLAQQMPRGEDQARGEQIAAALCDPEHGCDAVLDDAP
ncbi:hypothetical protein SSPS47_30945 [Streptomyces sp. S4.7]|nr:hypothetical protein SSPS47_30945 [Streptomyces sp. S4.7]